MDKVMISIKISFVFALCMAYSDSQASHHCSELKTKRQYVTSIYHTKCGFWGWKRCTRERCYYRVAYYVDTMVCCHGYGGTDCNIPICDPACLNSGLCVSPDNCECPSTVDGGLCELKRCSSATDCYPGVCQGSAICVCSSGFSGPNCQTMKDGPLFNECEGRLVQRDGVTDNILSSGHCLESVDNNTYVYTNQQSFSHIGFDVENTYQKLDVPDYPPGGFVRDYQVGIISTNGSYVLRGTDGSVVNSGVIVCTNAASKDNPFETLICEKTHPFSTGVSNRQILEIHVNSTTGGFKEIRDEDSANIYDTLYFTGQSGSLVTAFFFDLIPPKHCSEDDTCSQPVKALDVFPDVSKTSKMSAAFFGWDDTDSHIYQNKIELYGTFLGTDGYLHETSEPLDTYLYDIHKNNTRYEISLPSPGVFSFIGEVQDAAGNVARARATVLFDDISTVQMTDEPLNVSNAARLGDTFWLNTNDDVTVSWVGCFINHYLHDNGLLALIDPDFDGIDINFGNRTSGNFKSILGISKFYYNLAPSIELPDKINEDWIQVDPFADSVSIALPSLNTGNGNTFHIKAEDILWNSLSKRIYIRIDGTPPNQVGTPQFIHNVTNQQPGYFSSVDVQVSDEESGIDRIDFQLLDVAQSNAVIVEDSQDGQRVEAPQHRSRRSLCTLPSDGCYCTLENTIEECFHTIQRVYINNCWLVRFVGEPVNMKAIIYNQAQIPTELEYSLGLIPQLSGIDYYPAVERLHVEQAFGYGAIIEWTLPVSCYSISSILVVVSGGIDKQLTLPGIAVEVQINDLIPVRDYTVKVTIRYTNFQDGEAAEIVFNTGEAPDYDPNKLSVGAIVGIVIGCVIGGGLIAIGIVIALRVRAKKRPLPESLYAVRNNLANRFSHHHGKGPTNRDNPAKMTENVMSFDGDDEIYYSDDKNTGWKLPSSKVQIGDVITQGKFAIFYHGILSSKNGPQDVAIKMVHDPTDRNKTLLQSKMNYLATAVKPHPNLVNCMGGVEEGPMLLLELCDKPLKTWLQDITKMDDSVLDQMYLFSVHIGRALKHLHENKIMHRRLGARNIMLKTEFKRLVAKVTGFGPMKNPGDEATLPIKWMAPEQLGKGQGKARSYNEKTDVWSFAVTIWEIFSKGQVPYPKNRSANIKDELDAGVRLDCPDICPADLYNNVMTPSWDKNPSSRPDMPTLLKRLEMFVSGSSDQEYYADGSETSGQASNMSYMYAEARYK